MPLVVFGLSAFFAVWLWWLEGDIAGCFKPGRDKIPPSPTPSPGTGGRQLAIGGSTAGGTVVDHTNTTSLATGDERPICSYYEWCAPGRTTTHLQPKQPTCLTTPCSAPRIKYVIGNLVGVGLTAISPVSGNVGAELFDLLIATWSLTLTGATRLRATKPRRASSHLSPRVAPRHGHWGHWRAGGSERPCHLWRRGPAGAQVPKAEGQQPYVQQTRRFRRRGQRGGA